MYDLWTTHHLSNVQALNEKNLKMRIAIENGTAKVKTFTFYFYNVKFGSKNVCHVSSCIQLYYVPFKGT